jgi:hypothetical protein
MFAGFPQVLPLRQRAQRAVARTTPTHAPTGSKRVRLPITRHALLHAGE